MRYSKDIETALYEELVRDGYSASAHIIPSSLGNHLPHIHVVRTGGYETDMVIETNQVDFDVYADNAADAMEQAFGIRPIKAVLGLDLVCVFETEEQVRNMTPDQELLKQIEGRIQNATARGTETDCVSRSFCPKLAIAEDPVCGSAHCQIADYWSHELGKKEIKAYQASRRGGYLDCALLDNGRIAISGEAVLVAVTEIVAELK